MPRQAYTKDGEAVFVRLDQPLPVSDLAFNVAMLEALTDILNEQKLLNLRFEEAFQTGINEGDV